MRQTEVQRVGETQPKDEDLRLVSLCMSAKEGGGRQRRHRGERPDNRAEQGDHLLGPKKMK